VVRLSSWPTNNSGVTQLTLVQEEREMMPLLKYLGVGSTPWSPMAKGREWLWRVVRRPDLSLTETQTSLALSQTPTTLFAR
jgi:hypothetical protein